MKKASVYPIVGFIGIGLVVVIVFMILCQLLYGTLSEVENVNTLFYFSLTMVLGFFTLLIILLVFLGKLLREIMSGYQSICEKEIEKDKAEALMKEQYRHKE